MTRGALLLAALLSYAVLTLWIEERWAWSLLQCAVFLAFALWTALQFRSPRPVHFIWWLVPIGAAPVWALVQLALQRTIYRWGTWNAALTWTTWAVLFFLALQFFAADAPRRWFLTFAVWFGFALSVVSTLQMFTSGGKIFWLFPSGYTDYVMGPFMNRNQYAAFLELIVPIALWQALRDPGRALSYGAMAAAMLASVVASASRAGTVLVCAELLVVVLLIWVRSLAPRRAVTRAMAACAALAIVFIMLVNWQPLRKRFIDPDPFAGRREFVESSLAMLRDRPAFGFGLGNWSRAYPRYALFDDGSFINQAHNDWLQWAVEGGLPFFLILLSLALMAAPAALQSVWAIGLLCVWMHALVEYPFAQRPGLGAWFFVLLALLAAHRNASRDSRRYNL